MMRLRHFIALTALATTLASAPSAQTNAEVTLAVPGATNQTPWVAAHGAQIAVV